MVECPYCGEGLPFTGEFQVDWWEKIGVVKVKCSCGKEFEHKFMYVGTYDPDAEDFIEHGCP
ncbi:MAG: hypothetical protein QXJ09_07730 [Candidatus Caldarchaeum sp.]